MEIRQALSGRLMLSTPEQKCIGLPEQECISDAGKRAPNWGFFIWHQA
jgi:hypothetical protein